MPKVPTHTTLDEAHQIFRRWLGGDYDTDAINAVLAAAGVETTSGDPLWLLVSGSGNAKTETAKGIGRGARCASAPSAPKLAGPLVALLLCAHAARTVRHCRTRARAA